MSNLSSEAKHSLLCHHIAPPNILPTTYSRGCNRKFNTTWLTKYPFLLYSPKLDGFFYGPCSFFLSSDKRKDKGLLVNRSYSNWSKIGNALSNHSYLLYHLDCVQYTDILKNSIDNPASRIDVMANSDIQMRMDENRHIIRQIVCGILFLGKQGLPFRGDNEDLNITKNPGNYYFTQRNCSIFEVYSGNTQFCDRYGRLWQDRKSQLHYFFDTANVKCEFDKCYLESR